VDEGLTTPHIPDERFWGATMPDWAWWFVALAALLIGAPVMAYFGVLGGRAQRGTGMAMILLGFGSFYDPPTRHLAEASEEKPRESPTPGDPPTEE
jgi:hypothetical protein